MLDYLVVGLGLAGVSFCEQLEENNKTFHVISDDSQTSSSVAGGLYNPVILKRFTLAWKAKEQLEAAGPFYRTLEKKLGVKLNHPMEITRRFHSIEEQNLWFEAMDKPVLGAFLSGEIRNNSNARIHAPYGFGSVLQTGRVATDTLVRNYLGYLAESGRLTEERFMYHGVQLHEDTIRYKSLAARNLVFTEGFGLRKNPYFNYLPLRGNKGEYVIIEAPELKEDKAIKSGIFCIPLGEHRYKIGANYDRDDLTNRTTERTKVELLRQLGKFIRCDYEVIGQVAGVRPGVVDRRPLVGRHPLESNLYVLNGFGSRGVLIAPYVAPLLYQYIEDGVPLAPEIDIARFEKKWFRK